MSAGANLDSMSFGNPMASPASAKVGEPEAARVARLRFAIDVLGMLPGLQYGSHRDVSIGRRGLAHGRRELTHARRPAPSEAAADALRLFGRQLAGSDGVMVWGHGRLVWLLLLVAAHTPLSFLDRELALAIWCGDTGSRHPRLLPVNSTGDITNSPLTSRQPSRRASATRIRGAQSRPAPFTGIGAADRSARQLRREAASVGRGGPGRAKWRITSPTIIRVGRFVDNTATTLHGSFVIIWLELVVYALLWLA